MSSRIFRRHLLVIFLFLIQLIFGIMFIGDHGISWDEPFFYDYAESIRSAYSSITAQSSPDFEQVYGKSAEDHKYYGPAYLLIAQPVAHRLADWFDLEYYDSWHATNFLFFNIGLIFFYLTLLFWIKLVPAAFATAMMAWQPLLFGHAFINPKDIPFLVFCVITNYFGIALLKSTRNRQFVVFGVLFGVFLGLTASIRVIGPLIGVFFLISALFTRNKSVIISVIVSGIIAISVMTVTWPFLWSDPVSNLLVVLKHMSNNPTELAVLYEGILFRANVMPLSYIPKMIFFTLTEPVFALSFCGFLIFSFKRDYRKAWIEVFPTLMIFIFILGYILISRPAVYDGFRHFLFILPALFILAGFFFDFLFTSFPTSKWVFSLISILLLLPGFIGIIHYHPYQYTYYNFFAGGVSGAFRNYETDYWLTCYDEALHWFEVEHPEETLFTQREIPLALASGTSKIKIEPLPAFSEPPHPGMYLFHTRANLDLRSEYRSLETVKVFGLDTAEFCLIKKAP